MNQMKAPPAELQSTESALETKHLKDTTQPLFDEVFYFLKRFIAYPSEDYAVAHTLWIFHAHLIDCFDSTPRLAFLSAEPASGKTRALEITQLLVPNPVEAVNVTPAYLFRKVGENIKPTILYDEIDTVFGAKAKDNEEIRGLLNAGHRRGAVAGRCTKIAGQIRTEEIPAYCAVALAGLGIMPDTIISRSIVIRMRRRAPNESIQQFRRRLIEPKGEALRAKIENWCEQNSEHLKNTYPELPALISDRNADIWEPLIAIAEQAGEAWLEKARVTAVTLVTQSSEIKRSLGVQLLADLEKIFTDKQSLPTNTILNLLNDSEDLPWGDLNGKPLDARKLARMLKEYGIAPTTIRVKGNPVKGYKKESFHEAWERNLQ